ncbi:MAG: PAS domain-containing protein [Alphaproteobacteria bacterium]|nr:PAS domain-containing protein [Alphaproteobacteria bacterium]
MTDQLFGYWTKIKGERPFPSEQEIDLADIRDVWDHCFLIQIKKTADIIDYRYIYMGESIKEAYGDDLTGQSVYSRLVSPEAATVVSKFHKVLDTLSPVFDESEFVNLQDNVIKYRQCLLPLGAREGIVDYILGGMSWK